MKKLLNISVIAALAALPMAANATPVAGDPGATTAGAAEAANPPKYALVESDASDSGLATAGYVKGAYNAAIKAVNKVATSSLTADGTATLTHKTIDANGTGNNITNLEKDNFASGAVVDSETGIAAVGSASDDKFVTEKAVAGAITTATSGMVTETGTQTLTNKTISGGTVSGATITGGTIDADSTTISNLETDNFKSGVVRSSTDTIRASGSASDTALVTEKAVASKIEGAITDLGIGDYATKAGVLATIDEATVESEFTGTSVTGTVTSNFTNGEVTGGVTLPIVSTWGATTSTDTAYANSVTGTATGDVSSTFSNGAAEGTVTSTVSAPANYNPGTGA